MIHFFGYKPFSFFWVTNSFVNQLAFFFRFFGFKEARLLYPSPSGNKNYGWNINYFIELISLRGVNLRSWVAWKSLAFFQFWLKKEIFFFYLIKNPQFLVLPKCNFDVVSLFTKIPVNLAVKVAEEILREDASLGQRTSLPVGDIIHLLSFCLKTTQFTYLSTILWYPPTINKFLVQRWVRLSLLSLLTW